MFPLIKEIMVYMILQWLNEENLKESLHKLEKESGMFFNMRYFEEALKNGQWEVVEDYLSGFTKIDDNRYSMKIFFEIRKQKYLEALDTGDYAKAVEVLSKELRPFSPLNETLYKELAMLLTLRKFRFIDIRSARLLMAAEVRKLIESNPIFCGKLQIPIQENSRLRTLINMSLSWQHQRCQNPEPNPDIKTQFMDHVCGQQPKSGPSTSQPSRDVVGTSSSRQADIRTIISIARPGMKRFRPTGITAKIMKEVINRMPGCAPTWKEYPSDIKDALYAEFKARYRFASPEDEALGRTIWERTCAQRYPDNMWNLRNKALRQNETNDIAQTRGHPPRGIRVEVWDRLIDYWLSDEFQTRSAFGRANRSSCPHVVQH